MAKRVRKNKFCPFVKCGILTMASPKGKGNNKMYIKVVVVIAYPPVIYYSAHIFMAQYYSILWKIYRWVTKGTIRYKPGNEF